MHRLFYLVVRSVLQVLISVHSHVCACIGHQRLLEVLDRWVGIEGHLLRGGRAHETKLVNEYLGVPSGQLGASALDLDVVVRWQLLLLFLDDCLVGQQLLARAARDPLHELDYSFEGLLVFLDLGVLLLRAEEYELGLLLSGSALHLDERLDCEQFVQTDHLVASRHVQALLHHVRRNQDVDVARSEVVQSLVKLQFGKLDGAAGRELLSNSFELEFVTGLDLCRLVSLVHQVFALRAHREPDPKLLCVEKLFSLEVLPVLLPDFT